jgi:UPF0755 protein
MKTVFRFILLLILLTTAAAFAVWQDAEYLLRQPLPILQARSFEIESGEKLSSSLNQLATQKLIAPERLKIYLRLYARFTDKANYIKAGEYELTPDMNGMDFINLIISGKTVLHELRLIEGWNFEQVMAAVNANEFLEHTLKDADAAAVMKAIGKESIPAEGRFFPDTYNFPKRTTDAAFLQRALMAMESTLNSEWTQRMPDVPYASPEDALIMASIIEKETGVPTERAEVAGVFVRRLRLDMKLQTDPTVIYGKGAAYDGKLTRTDLQADTPYNSYTRKGLPPTPICMPGRAAIHAALHPMEGNALFFVARKDGTHKFSDTLEQHNRAVSEFQLKRTTPVQKPRLVKKHTPVKKHR